MLFFVRQLNHKHQNMITKEQLKSEIDSVEDEQLLEFIHSLIQKTSSDNQAEPSLMSQLRSVQITAPSDFAQNIDAYLNNEKSV
jgi:hypothetical protein